MSQLAGRRAALSIAALGTCAIAQSAEADEIAVTPYRPTVSTPAALSAPDWIEVEFGLMNSNGGIPTVRDSAPYSVKLAFSDDWGVRIGGEIWVRDVGATGQNINGVGDTGIVLKRRFAVNERSAFGLELGVMAPTAPAGLAQRQRRNRLQRERHLQHGLWLGVSHRSQLQHHPSGSGGIRGEPRPEYLGGRPLLCD